MIRWVGMRRGLQKKTSEVSLLYQEDAESKRCLFLRAVEGAKETSEVAVPHREDTWFRLYLSGRVA